MPPPPPSPPDSPPVNSEPQKHASVQAMLADFFLEEIADILNAKSALSYCTDWL